MHDRTEGVKKLLGEPKKAILSISLPMMVAMLVNSIYNIVDGFWVAGLGADALAAVGLFFPFLMVVIALGAGIGVGGSSAISRRIGANNKEGADNTVDHTIIIGIVLALVISLPMLPFLDDMFSAMTSNTNVVKMATQYGSIILGGAFILIFYNMANAILRGEGDTKRAMYAIIFGSVMNASLDPVLIYTLDLGVAGAAWSTVLSMSATSLIFIYWLFHKKDTFVDLDLRHFRPDKDILKEIFEVGIPSSLAQLSMSFSIVALNVIVIAAGGSDGVAVFTSGWRIINIGIIPLIGMAMGVTAVTGAAYGAREKEKLKISYLYAVKIGIMIEAAAFLIVLLFAPQIAYIFTYSPDSARIYGDLVTFLRITSLMFIVVPLGMLTSSMFRGVKMGVRSLIVTILRTIFFQVPFAFLFGITLGYGLIGIWAGIVLGNLTASVITFIWGKITVETIFEDMEEEPKKAFSSSE